MFTGSVCSQARDWFKANAWAFVGHRVFCGCSGNFTFETILSGADPRPVQILGNDVSLYSCALGAYFTGEALTGLDIAEPEYEWLRPYLVSPHAVAATMIVMLEAAPFAEASTTYHRRFVKHIHDNFSAYHQKTMAKLAARKDVLRVAKFYPVDVSEFLAMQQPLDTFICYMPTYAGGYEKLYRFLDKVFRWDGRPAYTLLDKDRKEELLIRMVSQGRYVYVDDVRHDELGVVAIIEGGSNRAVYIHSNIDGVGTDLYRRSKIERKKPRVSLLMPDDKLDNHEISFVMLDAKEFAWVRDQYLKASILPAEPQWRFGVCLGGKLIGLVGWKRREYEGGGYWLICDLALPSNVYRRLAKLVVMIANSREMLRLLRQQSGRFWDFFVTVVFTDKPVSMKYRGALDLMSRNEAQGKLIYGGKFTASIEKAVRKWHKLESQNQD